MSTYGSSAVYIGTILNYFSIYWVPERPYYTKCRFAIFPSTPCGTVNEIYLSGFFGGSCCAFVCNRRFFAWIFDETETETLKSKITKDHKNILNVKGINKNTVET